MKNTQSEANLLRQLKRFCDRRQDTRIWRNSVGRCFPRGGGCFSYGLGRGTADLVGYQKVTITPDMVGQTFARFLAVEIKREGGRIQKGQAEFLKTTHEDGCKACMVESTEALKGFLDQ